MQVSLNTSTLQKIYDGVTTVYYARLEDKNNTPRKTIMNLASLKTHLSSILDINIIFFQQKEMIINSPYIHRYSKDAKDNIHIEFTLSGLMLIEECLDLRLQILWEYAKEIKNNPTLFQEVNESITQAEEVLEKVQQYLVPMYN
ncbi:MAG TPA: hypothetical protein ENK52_01100 [Saprospiraceae bacterium]|nr:hypothetical protein [Saprospiraceae bacterium]